MQKVREWAEERWLTDMILRYVGAQANDMLVRFPVTGPDGCHVFDAERYFGTGSRWKFRPQYSRKSHVLYGYAEQREKIKNWGFCVLTEGIPDSLAVRRLGLPALGCLGSYLSEIQARLIYRYAKIALIWGDGDDGGREFAQTPDKYGLTIRGVVVDGYDPASYLAQFNGQINDTLRNALRLHGSRYQDISHEGDILSLMG